MTLLERSRRPERIDEPGSGGEELEESLRHIAEVNRWLGGARSLRIHLRRHLPAPRASIVDVGSGGGELPAGLARRARRGGRRWRMVAVDRSAAMARRAAGEAGIPAVVADGLRLPFPDDAFDAAVSSLTLHHLDWPGPVALLREMRRVSRVAVVASDLERNVVNWLGALLLARTRWRGNRFTSHDGPVSVRRGFTRDELAEAGARAGLRDVEVHRHWFFRLALVGRP